VIARAIDDLLELPKISSIPWNFILGFSVLLRVRADLPWGGIETSVKSRNLVTDVIYSYCRNPMVLGYSMLPVVMGIIFISVGMFFSHQVLS
jgi:hypothetical protein